MDQRKSQAIVIDGCSGVIIDNNSAIGFDVGIEATNSQNLRATNNRLVSSKALEIFAELEKAIHNLDLDAESARKYGESLNALHDSAGTESFLDKYKAFLATTADHVTVLAPLATQLFMAMS